MVVDHPLCAVLAARFLVGDGEVHERPARLPPAPGQVPEGDGHRRGDVEHVDRAAAPHLAVDQLAAERVAGPPVGIGGDDVRVAHQAERRGRGIAALDAGHDRPTAGTGVEPLDPVPRAGQLVGQQIGAADLLPGIRRTVVDAPVADQRLQQLRGGSDEWTGHGRSIPPRSPGCEAAQGPVNIVGDCGLASQLVFGS